MFTFGVFTGLCFQFRKNGASAAKSQGTQSPYPLDAQPSLLLWALTMAYD